MSPAFLIDAQGKRFPLHERFVLGRAAESDLVLPGPGVTKRHARLTRLLDDRIELEDLHTTNGTYVNGQPVQAQVLESGDLIEVMEHRLRFEREPLAEPRVDAVAASIAAVWHDEAAVQVRIDELLESGAPLASQLSLGADVPLPAHLVQEVTSGDLVVTRWRGLVRTARFRSRFLLQQRDPVLDFLRSEAAALLEELILPDFTPRLGLGGFAHATLTRLRFGPFFDEAAAEAARAALARESFPKLPRLRPPELEVYRRAWLEFAGGERRELSAGRREVFATCSVDRQEGRWVVLRKDAKATLKVNRVERYSAELLPGDVVRAGPLEFTLRAQ